MKDLITGILEDLIDDFNTKFKSHDELMDGIEDATNRIVLIAQEQLTISDVAKKREMLIAFEKMKGNYREGDNWNIDAFLKELK